MTKIVAVVMSVDESLVCQHLSMFSRVLHTVQNMASNLLPLEKKNLRPAKIMVNVVATNPEIYKRIALRES